MRLWCRHAWKVEDRTVLPSAYEQVSEKVTSLNATDIVTMFRKAVVYLLRCEKCGRVRTLKEVNP